MFPPAAGSVDLRGDGLPSCVSFDHASVLSSVESLGTYEDVRGLPALRQVLASQLGVDEHELLITNGASEAVALALLSILDHGAAVAIPCPGFPGYRQLAGLFGLRVLPYLVGRPLSRECRENIRSADLVVVVAPHNPTGIDDFSDVVRAAERGWLMRDVSHSGVAFSSAIGSSAGPSEIMIGTLSKVLRVPGLRVGFLMTRRHEVIEVAASVKTHMSMATNSGAQSLATSALRDGALHERITRQQAGIDEARAIVRAAVAQSATLRVTGGLAGSHLLVESKVDDDEVCLWTRLADAGVAGLPGAVFDAPYPCVRLCYGQPLAIVRLAAERLAKC